jgi:hypothetical protein
MATDTFVSHASNLQMAVGGGWFATVILRQTRVREWAVSYLLIEDIERVASLPIDIDGIAQPVPNMIVLMKVSTLGFNDVIRLSSR